MRALRIVALVAATSPVAALAGEPAASADVTTSVAVTGYYYVMRDGRFRRRGRHARPWPLAFQARYNYEVHNAARVRRLNSLAATLCRSK
jgi:hypothetical protein